ncbi:hypothetical protein AAFF_G00369570 [Aldrovandia affinis]|uniref:SGNH hydrolase-type esterase domain-containing protein n=1 Tax=Aldrovandia affinis TaxID=143900 RepID=A0AAD7VZ90_9TELE|nr:hypothetical protein AAFF_G00369570 [Aldrovandia affinis]
MADLSSHLAHLPEEQRADILQLIAEYPVLFSDTPTRTSVIKDDIEVNNSAPIRQHPYRVNVAKRAAMKKEELTLARLAESDTTQQLRHELQQLKQDNQETMAELRRENQKTTSELKETQKRLRQLTQTIRELEEENSTLRAQTLKLKEDTANRDLSFSRELQQMKEQLRRRAVIDSPGHTLLPAAQPLNTEPNPNRPAKPEAQVVLLMDSNGKYLDTKRLFPGLITRAKRCQNTGQAMELLRQDTLGNPQYIVVHTGTNDLHTPYTGGTAEAMTKMAKRASREFPNSRVVISPLLPRTDTPPHVIHEINMEISRSCAALPNIHLAHHTNIGTWDLHDRLHLNKAG